VFVLYVRDEMKKFWDRLISWLLTGQVGMTIYPKKIDGNIEQYIKVFLLYYEEF
jgi:multimeric flavodoxin WrbA